MLQLQQHCVYSMIWYECYPVVDGVMRLQEGRLVRSLKGHGHWVNTLALSAEYALRTGAYDHTATAPSDPKEAQAKALQRCDPTLECAPAA